MKTNTTRLAPRRCNKCNALFPEPPKDGGAADVYDAIQIQKKKDAVAESSSKVEQPAPKPPVVAVIGEWNAFQQTALASGKPSERYPDFLEYDDIYIVNPANLPSGSVVETDDASVYYTQHNGKWTATFMDLDGIRKSRPDALLNAGVRESLTNAGVVVEELPESDTDTAAVSYSDDGKISLLLNYKKLEARAASRTGYAVLPDGSHICYACADAMQREELKDRSKSFVAYVSSDGRSIITWTGGKLMDVTQSWPCQLTRPSHWHDSRSYRCIRARDVHGAMWYGRGSPGIAIKMRAAKRR